MASPNLKKTPNYWLHELVAEGGIPGKEEIVPEGWLTMKQMIEETGFSESTMNGRVTKWIKNGQMIRKKFRVRTGHQIIGVWHYHKK